MIASPLLPLWIRFDIVLIVVKQLQLNIRLSGLVQEVILIDPEIGVLYCEMSGGVPTCLFFVASSDSRLARTSAS